MTIRNTYAAEAWDKVYNAFSQINFTSYDYDTVKESLIQYLQIYHPEHFNDFIESSELVALLEMFAYVAELLAYRVDTAAHENFMTTAQRKQSVLKLARLISYRASRNIPARGLVKINTVRVSEDVYDSLGNNLSGVTITWNDPNNTNWKEQFFLVMNKALTSKYGQPSKAFQIGDVLMQLYTFNNNLNSFRNGVFAFSATGAAETVAMEFVPSDVDTNGPFERSPDNNSQMNIIYASDGKGDGSDFTGFLGFVKQGSLVKTDYTIPEPVANRRIELSAINVNDTDVWVYRVNDAGAITENWKRVETLSEQNIYFNNDTSTRKKYEVETTENDGIALIFGDGNFSDMAVGDFQLWTRISVNQDLNIPKNRVVGQAMGFNYVAQNNNTYEFSCTFSLTAAIQNNAGSETIEHIRQAAPSTYYSQNRMVNGQDYNTYMLKDPTILRLKTVNRTFAGQPKYIEWNDSSRTYENVKLFGDDLTLLYDISADMVETKSSAKTIVDSFIEPLLQTNALLNTLTHVLATSASSEGIISYPRRKFIEDNRAGLYKDIDGNPVSPYGSSSSVIPDGSLNERTVIQGALDQHWYGDPLSYVVINGIRHGVISDPILNPMDDGRLYISDLPRTIDGINTYPPGDTGSGLQPDGRQKQFGLKFNRFLSAFGNGTFAIEAGTINGFNNKNEILTFEMTSDVTAFTVISNWRGKLPNYSIEFADWASQTTAALPFNAVITPGSTAFAQGDAFVIDITANIGTYTAAVRTFGSNNTPRVNLNGWWQIIPNIPSTTISTTAGPNLVQQMNFDPNADVDSWVFLISRNDNALGEVDSWNIYNRNIKIIAESLTTKFWFNQNTQIIDPATNKPVYDKIRILRSNLDTSNQALLKAGVYDTVAFIYDADGVINFNRIELLPTDTENFTQAGDTTPDNTLQFITFSDTRYEYFVINLADPANPTIPSDGWLVPASATYIGDVSIVNSAAHYDVQTVHLQGGIYGTLTSTNEGGEFNFQAGASVSVETSSDGSYMLGRRRSVNSLDFMWQHFSPVTHLIDPSVTNIHDAFILTRGYYNNVIDYVKGYSDINPQPPTPLELRTSYGSLLANKMLSDTVVMHSGKIKLLFGALADQKLRARFKVVKAPSASFSDERIKSEIISVIDTFFDIQNWDFGDTFYATELISLIHQRLTVQIASVVIVPMYSVNSFGSLFTIDSGFDEILQSAASVNDIEIVDALTPTVIRQVR